MYCFLKKRGPFDFERTLYAPDSDSKVTKMKKNCVGFFLTPMSVILAGLHFHLV